MTCVWSIGLSSSGCAWVTGKGKPSWVDGTSSEYPPARYLVGVGQGESRSAAADHAYAAIARIFNAEVAAQAKDWESYQIVEHQGSASSERRLNLDTVTKVTTEKVLENVGIADAWYDSRKDVHYALAVMNRPQAEAALLERMTALESTVESDVTESRRTTDKLDKVRALRRAVKNVVLREAYNADLRVIRATGQGQASPYRVDQLSVELERFLAANFLMAVRVSGDQAEPVRRALAEGLLREGIQVVTEEVGGDVSPALLLRGTVQVFPVDVHDPQFKYVRWCSDFDIIEPAAGRVVGALSRGGKEGHVTEREATAKTLRVMQQELSSVVAKAIAAHVFGEATLPLQAAMPAGCPRGASSGKSMQ